MKLHGVNVPSFTKIGPLLKIHFILFNRGLLSRRTHVFDRVLLKSSWRKEFPDKRHAISLRDFCCLCSLPGRNGRKSIPSGKTSGEAINIFSNLGNHTNKNKSFLRSSICCQQITACYGATFTACREKIETLKPEACRMGRELSFTA